MLPLGLWALFFLCSLVTRVCSQEEPKCRDLDYCNYRGTCIPEDQICECETGFTGVSCANLPPILFAGVEIPGGISGEDTRHYVVEQGQYKAGQRIFMRTNRGQLDVFASIGLVPTKDHPPLIQFVARDTEENNVVVVVADTEVPVNQAPLDLNLYVTVRGVLSGEQADYDIWTLGPAQPEGPIPKIMPWAGILAIVLCVLMCLGIPAFLAYMYWRSNHAPVQKKRKSRGSKNSRASNEDDDGDVQLSSMDNAMMAAEAGYAEMTGMTAMTGMTGAEAVTMMSAEGGGYGETGSTYLSPYANNYGGESGYNDMSGGVGYAGYGGGSIGGGSIGGMGGGGSLSAYPAYPNTYAESGTAGAYPAAGGYASNETSAEMMRPVY